ncbi:DUF4401 domain-containing protein [Leptospira sp. GIMC2001]|uniref:DUF4401 domain-containing protein n=1 Tax=Leptospira sp. GIMC2001 TaxID=1513297 RepID=UPI00234AFE52|nr:DUF4401 domain-containing protein [Leptospira sp. GIMC2001]WCL47658.1 DUF4401 domain-containing protein [Leptospira sp. GIMC2001]
MNDKLKNLILKTKQAEGSKFVYDEEKIISESELQSKNSISIAMLGFTMFGALLSSLAFFGFLMLFEFNSSYYTLLILGLILIAGSIYMSTIVHELVYESFIISAYLSGIILVGYSLFGLDLNDNLVSIAMLAIAIVTIIFSPSYMVLLLAVLSIHTSLISLINWNLQDYYGEINYIYTILLAWFITFLLMKESFIIARYNKLSKIYDPVRLGSIAVFLVIFFLNTLSFSNFDFEKNSILQALTSIMIIGCILVFIFYRLSRVLGLNDNERILALVLTFVLLIPTLFYPAISGSFLIIFLCFYVNYNSGLVAGLVGLVYFLFQYYYNLSFTLIEKSGILLVSGLLCLGIYSVIIKRFPKDFKNEAQ